MKVLIIKLHALGDVIASTPFFKLIKDYDKSYEIHHLVHNSCHEITVNNPYLNQQIITNLILSKNENSFLYFYIFNFLEMIRIITILRKNKYDVVYIFHRNFIFQTLCKLSSIKTIVGFESNKNLFLDYKFKYSFNINRTIQEFKLIFNSGLKIEKPKKLEFFYNEKKINKSLIKKLPKKYFVCNPGGGNIVSSAKNRLWPIKNYIEIINQLNLPTIILGNGKLDENISRHFINKSPNYVNLINKTNLNESAYILKNSQLYFGNDSSMLFLASAMQVKTVGLFGPTQVEAANPLGLHQFFVKGCVHCSPCYNPFEGTKGKMYTCNNNICMQSINVSKVVEKIEETLI